MLIDSGSTWEVEGQGLEPLGLCVVVILQGQTDMSEQNGVGSLIFY